MPISPVSAKPEVTLAPSLAPPPAASAGMPAAANSDRLTAATPARGAVPATTGWASAAVQEAYGDWVGQRWEQWKTDHEEADCKTAASRMMEDFRADYKATNGVDLPEPLPGVVWINSTKDHPQVYSSTVPTKGPLRSEYAGKRGQNMIDGVNHIMRGWDANSVARRATTPITQRDGQAMVTGHKGAWHINQDLLKPGDVIFQAHPHPDDDKWDHTMTVVGVDKGADGRTSQLRIAIGSFDDLKDADSATPPTGGQVDVYAYEMAIDFTNGAISDAHVTWQSDADLRPIGPNESLKERIHRGAVIMGAEQRATEIHRWGK